MLARISADHCFMKKLNIFLEILLILVLFTLTSCKRQYVVEGEKVYYKYWNEGSGKNKELLDSVDAKTFKEVKSDCDILFAKDNKHVYINGQLIKNIDPNTFIYAGNYFIKDKDSVYFLGVYMDIGIDNNIKNCVIKGVDPSKLILIKNSWAKAENTLIHGNQTVKLDDINDFMPIDETWGKTRNKIIYTTEILHEADLATFEIINSYTGKDKNHTYEYGKIKK